MIAELYLVLLLPIQGMVGFVLAYSAGPSVTYPWLLRSTWRSWIKIKGHVDVFCILFRAYDGSRLKLESLAVEQIYSLERIYRLRYFTGYGILFRIHYSSYCTTNKFFLFLLCEFDIWEWKRKNQVRMIRCLTGGFSFLLWIRTLVTWPFDN